MSDLDLSTLPPAERATKSLLFQPLKLGAVTVSHRIALAPLTRNRGIPSKKHKHTWIPNDVITEYYTQRATEGGLLIGEAMPVSQQVSAGAALRDSRRSVPRRTTQECPCVGKRHHGDTRADRSG